MKTKPQLDGFPRGFLEGLRFDPLPGIGLKGDLPSIGIDVLAPDDAAEIVEQMAGARADVARSWHAVIGFDTLCRLSCGDAGTT